MTDDSAHSYRLSDELLKTISTGTGRCYAYEGRAMASELIERRAREASAAKAAPSFGAAALPYP